MKVIVNGVIIETGFIKYVKKISSDIPDVAGSYMTMVSLEIGYIIGEPLVVEIGTTEKSNHSSSYDREIEDMNCHADSVIRFLDEHSDSPNWPFPEISTK